MYLLFIALFEEQRVKMRLPEVFPLPPIFPQFPQAKWSELLQYFHSLISCLL